MRRFIWNSDNLRSIVARQCFLWGLGDSGPGETRQTSLHGYRNVVVNLCYSNDGNIPRLHQLETTAISWALFKLKPLQKGDQVAMPRPIWLGSSHISFDFGALLWRRVLRSPVACASTPVPFV